MIDLVALRSLLALEAHGTVSAAALATGYTPSAVSQQIKRLERDLGVDLLERAGRGVTLTDHGRRLVGHGQGILDQLEAAMAGLADDRQAPHGRVRLAAFSTAVRGLVAPLLCRLAETQPALTCEVVEVDPAEGVDLVAAGQADLAVVHSWVGVGLHRPEHLRSRVVGQDLADLLVHRSHPLAERARVTPADLLDEPWIGTPAGSICHAWFVHMFAGFPRTPQIRFRSMEFASHLTLVANRLGVALVPRLGRGPLPGDVVAVPVVDPVPTREIGLVWRGSSDAAPTLRFLREQVAAAAQAG